MSEVELLRKEVNELRERLARLECRPTPGVYHNPWPGQGPLMPMAPTFVPNIICGVAASVSRPGDGAHA